MLTAALIGPYFIDWSGYRSDFEHEASAILGRKVDVRGDVHARLLPFPSVSFADVSVAGGPDGMPGMTIESFSMDAELAPFMHGDLLIFDMRMVKPRGVIAIGKDGAIDWLARPSTPVDAARISVEKLTVTGGSIEVRHGPSGRTHVLSEINTTLSAKALSGPWRADGSLRVDGAKTTFAASTGPVDATTGRMHLRLRAEPAPLGVSLDVDGEVAPVRAELRYTGAFKAFEIADKPAVPSDGGEAAKAAPPRYKVSGTFTLGSTALDVNSFRLETGPISDPYTADGKATIALGAEPHFSVEATGAQVQFDSSVAEGKGSLGVEDRLHALGDMLGALPKPTIPGDVKVDLPAVVVGDTTIRDVRLVAEPKGNGWTVASAAATLPGRTTLEANGFLTTAEALSFKGKLLLAIAQPSGFAAWVARDVDESIRKLPAAGFSANVDLGETRQSFSDLELQLGQSRFRGSIDSRQPAGADPQTDIVLVGGALDLEGLSAFVSLFVGQDGARHFLQSDVNLSLKAGPVTAKGFSAGTVDTGLRLRPDVIEVDRLAIDSLEGANIAATGTLRDFPRRTSGTLEASVTAGDLEPLLSRAAASAPDLHLLSELAQRIRSAPQRLQNADFKISMAVTPNTPATIKVDIDGSAGGNTLKASYEGSVTTAPENPVALSIDAHSEDASAVLAFAGLPTLPIMTVGPGDTRIEAAGTLAAGLPVSASFKGPGGSASFHGTMAAEGEEFSAKGKISVDADDIEPWLMATGTSLPGLGSGLPFTLDADGDYAKGLLVLNHIDGSAGEVAVGGDLNVEIREGRPRLSGALALDEVSLDPLAAIILGDAVLGDGTDAFAQDKSVPFAADIDVSAAALTAGASLVARNATFSLGLDANGLRIEDLKSTLYGGKLTGRFSVRNNGGTGLVGGQLSVDDADLETVPATRALTGRGSVGAAFSGSGKSIDAIVSSLSGSGRASVSNVVISGIAQDALPVLLKEADAIGREIDASKVAAFAVKAISNGKIDGGSADVAFTIAGGVLRAPLARLGNAMVSVSMELRAGLAADDVQSTGTITYAAGDDEVAGAQATVGFSLSGPIEAPFVYFATEPLAQFLAQRALEREQQRVEAAQAVLMEKQRLRREVRYYASLQAERDRVAEESRKAEEEAREKAEREAQARADAEAADAAAQAAAEQAQKDGAAHAVEQARQAKAADAKRRGEQIRSLPNANVVPQSLPSTGQ